MSAASGVVARQQFTYPSGDIYDGEWNTDCRKHGFGKINLTDGTVYSGKFENGFCCGHGVLSFPNGDVYEGEFTGGKYGGYGVFTRSDGMKFEGQFKKGLVEGRGLITFADGSHGMPRQEGDFFGTELLERRKVPEAVLKAQQAQRFARKCINM